MRAMLMGFAVVLLLSISSTPSDQLEEISKLFF